jgi:hypothetical protein
MIPLHNAVSVNTNMQTANNLNNKAKNSSKKLISAYALLRMGSLKWIRLFGEFRSGSRLQILIVKHFLKNQLLHFSLTNCFDVVLLSSRRILPPNRDSIKVFKTMLRIRIHWIRIRFQDFYDRKLKKNQLKKNLLLLFKNSNFLIPSPP